MELLDNVNKTLKDGLSDTIREGSRVSIAAACFSMYAFQELKKQLEGIDELRFIFTSPTFTTEKTKKKSREFYIPRLSREKSLYGTEFEVRLRNELTQKAIAKECAEWIRSKVTFKSNITGEMLMGFANVDETSYSPINGFTTVDLGCERGNNMFTAITKTTAAENSRYYLSKFDEIWSDPSRLQDVTEEVIESISTAYNENSPDFIYFITLSISSASFLRTFLRTFFPMKQPDSREARFGVCSIASKEMLFLLSSTSLRNSTVVFLRTA